MLRILIKICLANLILALTLEGSWILQQVHELNVSLPVNFSYYVFRNQSVMGRMQIDGCEQLLYQFNIEGDNIYIDKDNELVRPVGQCSAN
jgi:hypothetical protein